MLTPLVPTKPNIQDQPEGKQNMSIAVEAFSRIAPLPYFFQKRLHVEVSFFNLEG